MRVSVPRSEILRVSVACAVPAFGAAVFRRVRGPDPLAKKKSHPQSIGACGWKMRSAINKDARA